MSAQRCIGEFQGTDRDQLLAWLGGILMNDLLRTRRYYHTEKRQVGREVRLRSPDSSENLSLPLPATSQTPSTEAVAIEEKRLLHHGGYGIVFRAFDTNLKQRLPGTAAFTSSSVSVQRGL